MKEFEIYNQDGSVTISRNDYLRLITMLDVIREKIRTINIIHRDFPHIYETIQPEYVDELLEHYIFMDVNEDSLDINSFITEIAKDLYQLIVKTIRNIPEDFVRQDSPNYQKFLELNDKFNKTDKSVSDFYFDNRIKIIEEVERKRIL